MNLMNHKTKPSVWRAATHRPDRGEKVTHPQQHPSSRRIAAFWEAAARRTARDTSRASPSGRLTSPWRRVWKAVLFLRGNQPEWPEGLRWSGRRWFLIHRSNFLDDLSTGSALRLQCQRLTAGWRQNTAFNAANWDPDTIFIFIDFRPFTSFLVVALALSLYWLFEKNKTHTDTHIHILF